MSGRRSQEDKEAYVKVYDLDALSSEVSGVRSDVRDLKDSIDKHNQLYVTKEQLELRMSKADMVVKFFWWVAGAVGLMMLATLYQLIIYGITKVNH